MSETICKLIFWLQLTASAVMLYHFIISIFAWKRDKTKKIPKCEYSFAVVIAAHNEESVIFDVIKSFSDCDYPKNLYDIFVVADNCEDKTAEIAKNAGAIVWKRTDDNNKGKGFALSMAFERLATESKKYDAVVIADADNIVEKSFLKELSSTFENGCEAVQGYIEAKNPYSSWVSASYHITHLCLNRLYQKARNNIGFPVQLNGTGFAVKTELIEKIRWDPSCLTEDMEITARLALSGIYAKYNENAVIYDEKPIDFSTSYKQRKRWMQGQCDVFSRYVVPIFKNEGRVNPLKLFDCAVYLVQPYIFVLTGIITILTLISPLFGAGMCGLSPFGAFFAVTQTIIQLSFIPVYLMIFEKVSPKILKYYIPYLIFVYSWIPVSFMGIINRKKKDWFHTKHTVCVSNE